MVLFLLCYGRKKAENIRKFSENLLYNRIKKSYRIFTPKYKRAIFQLKKANLKPYGLWAIYLNSNFIGILYFLMP